MWTIAYRGFYIHGYCDKTECRVVFPNGAAVFTAKTLHGAKCVLTRLLKASFTKEEYENRFA